MVTEEQTPAGEAAPALDEDNALNPDYVREILDALDAGRAKRLRKLVGKLHAADKADLLGLVRPDERHKLIETLGPDLGADVLSELDEDIRDEVLQVMQPEKLAEAVAELPSDDALYLLEDLDADRQQEILGHVPDKERTALEIGLRYGEESAGRLMQREVLTLPDYWTVGQALDHIRGGQALPDQFFELFVVDPTLHLKGMIPLSKLLRAPSETSLAEIMQDEIHLIPAEMDREEVAYLFNQYHLISAPVVDEDERIIGVITVDDVVDVIHQETGEDMLALAGVGDEGLSDTVIETTRQRFSWLFINLLTAMAASLVIALFGGTIEQKVALAVLMPIVASMGGNAGTQTLTVAVRALATKDLTATNALRIVTREVLVGGLNGIVFAVLMGIAAALVYEPLIGIVIAIAMIINLLAAGLAGILIPISLDHAGADPAVSSSVFVTTVTDIVGFFVFLGLATVILGL